MNDNIEKDLPSIDIVIDREGVWYYRGNEMVRKDIVSLFYQKLERDQQGQYLVRNGDEAFYIKVEDVPYAVKSIELMKDETSGASYFKVLLSDDSLEDLDLETLRIGKDNVLYCLVKGKTFEARFTRKAYYQLAEYIQYNSEKNIYYITLNNRLYEIQF